MYANQLINEAGVQKTWGPVIEESTGITEKSKLAWMSKYCHYHNLNESVYNTVHLNPNMNVQSMGNVTLPGDPGAMNAFPGQAAGSGDRPFSLLPLAMQVAAQTVGLDLVPVVPMQGPMGVLTYLDFVYGGGRVTGTGSACALTNGNSAPLLIKVPGAFTGGAGAPTAFVVDTRYYVASGGNGANASYELTYVGASRIDGLPIFRVRGNNDSTNATANGFRQGEEGYESLAVAISGAAGNFISTAQPLNSGAATDVYTPSGTSELVKALEDHITGFSGAAFGENNTDAAPSNIDGKEPYQRGFGESTPDNVMGLSLFNKSVAADTFQVAAAVTREQVQDLKQFGIDAVAQVEAVLVNELTQSINKYILDRIFRNGAQNAGNVNTVDAMFLSQAFGDGTTAVIAAAFNLGPGNSANTNITVGTAAATPVQNVTGGGETLGSVQRRIMSRILAASNLIATRGRRGPATFAVCGGKLGTALQDCAGFVAYPLSNTVNQAGGSLYPIGAVAGVTVYVDPTRAFDDLNICVGRKGDGNSPGLVFMPYLMAESVETIAEGTMAPKIAVKSRFALVDAGFHPETMYYTIAFQLYDGVDII